MDILAKPFLEEQIRRLEQKDYGAFLSEKAKGVFCQNLRRQAFLLLESTYRKLISEEAAGESPLAAMDPALLTTKQREKTVDSIHRKYSEGKLSLPNPLVSLLSSQLEKRTDAFLEMLEFLDTQREEISRCLLGGKVYSVITDISLGAGDSHRQGRTVCVVTTDSGKFVYKPRDMRGEQFIFKLVNKYLPDMVRVPSCFAFEDRLGAASFIEKKRAEGEEEAALFYRNFGGAAALFKALGSTDMHVENILCDGCYPAVIDLETILSPVSEGEEQQVRDMVLFQARRNSVFFTTLLPRQGINEQEHSPLMNCGEEGCAPFVDGKYVNVLPFLSAFEEGYHEAYERIWKNKDAICRELKEAAPEIFIRVILSNSQDYFNVLKKLYSYEALSTKEKAEQTKENVLNGMKKYAPERFVPVLESIISQMYRGDIPYYYLKADSTDLLSDGKEVARGFFGVSPLGHAVSILNQMSRADEEFDRILIRRCLEQYPVKIENPPEKTFPEPDERVLSREEAIKEAEDLFFLVNRLSIPSPGGKRLWGQIGQEGAVFQFCDPFLGSGLAGIALFSSALYAVSDKKSLREQAELLTGEILSELEEFPDLMAETKNGRGRNINLGEYSGLGGLLCALALIRRNTGLERVRSLQEKTIGILSEMDFSGCACPDRIGGIAGLISTLCRFEEYRCEKEIIQRAAERLLEMKKLEWHKKVLWQPFPDKKRPVSGAGHGLMGIAQALFAAFCVLKDQRYITAAREALDFEREIYNETFGTWPDLREYPPVGFMHGYCSGAPGIGIMLALMKKDGYQDPMLEKKALDAVNTLSLRERDHLCCGNSAIAEYYITVGDIPKAGSLLYAMKKRKDREGSFCYMENIYNNSITASFFYGCSGIGYEMLRYAFPERVLSVF